MHPAILRSTKPTRQYIRILQTIIAPELKADKKFWKKEFLEAFFEDPHTPFHKVYFELCYEQYKLKKLRLQRCKQIAKLISIA